MNQNKQIITTLKNIANTLNNHKLTWLVGGNGSLLIDGLNVFPNDIDIFVDTKEYIYIDIDNYSS